MTFEYESKIYLGEVALYVADLAYKRISARFRAGTFGRAGRTGGFGQGRTSVGAALSDQ